MEENKKYPTVSDVNAYLKQLVTNDENLKKVVVMGEISNFTNHARLGHLYFSLKDENAAIKAVMFKWNKSKLSFEPENGMKVVLVGSVNVFERDGIFQIVAENMIPYGAGALQQAYEKLKNKLEAEGLFDIEHKKKIPTIPKRIAVITAKKSAALQDIINIISRRYPLVSLTVIDTLVQGANAPESLCNAINKCKGQNFDTIIIGRGGGSMEDLWAFNDESLARAIYKCEIPVISAVGHEVDFTICDFVADMRAPTPSAAAELAVPSAIELHKYIDNKRNLLYNNISAKINRLQMQFDGYNAVLSAREPKNLISSKTELVNNLELNMRNLVKQQQLIRENTFTSLVSKLEVLSPLHTMSRGYSVVFNSNNEVISDTNEVKIGDIITTKVNNGKIISTVNETRES